MRAVSAGVTTQKATAAAGGPTAIPDDLLWHHVDDFDNKDFYRFEKLLNPSELERVRQAKTEPLQRTRLASRAILKEEISRRVKIPVQDLRLQTSTEGKPFLDLKHGCSLKFNLACSKGWMVHAFSDTLDIGVDLEKIDANHMTPHLMADILSKTEQAELENLEQQDRLMAFFQLWTTKEAVLKAAGVGLAGLAQLENKTADLFYYRQRHWQTRPIKAPNLFAAAIAWAMQPST